MKKKIIITVIVVAAIAAFAYLALRNIQNTQEETGIPRDAVPAEIAVVGTDTIISKVSVKGAVEIAETVIAYPASDGKAETVFFKQGDTVNKGDTVLKYSEEPLEAYRNQIADLNLQLASARLTLEELTIPLGEMDILAAQMSISQSNNDIRDLAAKISQADSVSEQINGELEAAEQKLGEARILFDAGIIAKNEFETYNDAVTRIKNEIKTQNTNKESLRQAMTPLQEALDYNIKRYESVLDQIGDNERSIKNRISQSKITLEQIELKISQIQKQIDGFVYEEYAPASGTLLFFNVSDGGYVTGSAPFMEIADTGYANLKITANVPESEAVSITLGQTAEISGSILGKERIAGEITKIQPIAEMKQVGNSLETVVGIELSFSDPGGRLRSGNTISADIITNVSEGAVVLPLMSTFSEADGREFVYVVNEDYTVTKREITLLAFSGMNVEVTNIAEGEKIVASPTPQIKDGSYIKPIIRNLGGV